MLSLLTTWLPHPVRAATHAAKAEAKQLWADHANLKTAVKMCLDLVEIYGFGPDGIAALLSLAKKYGDPVSVLTAVEAFGQLKKIRDEEAKHAAKVEEMEQREHELDGKYQGTLTKLDELTGRTLDVGKLVGNTEMAAADGGFMSKLVKLLFDPYHTEFGSTFNVALICANSLKAYVERHRSNFKFHQTIEDGLYRLVWELGGLNVAG